MAVAEGRSDSSVLRIRHAHGLKRHRAATFKVSNGPGLSQTLEAIVGQYLNRPAHAIMLCVDEKDKVQSLGDGHCSQSEPQRQQVLGRLRGKCGQRELGIPLTSDHMRSRQVSSGPHWWNDTDAIGFDVFLLMDFAFERTRLRGAVLDITLVKIQRRVA